MKKVLSLVTCSVLAACSCNDAQWEEVDSVTYEDVVYEEQAPVIVEPAPVYVEMPQVVQDCPCAEVAPSPCYQPCACQPMPKITKTKKIITTTTTYEEPCGKDVCEPVVTVQEEIVPVDVEVPVVPAPVLPAVSEPSQPVAPVVETPAVETPAVEAPVAEAPVEVKADNNFVEFTVEKNPYHSKVVDMRKATSKAVASTVNYSPEAYIVVATRATNRMLQDTSVIYDNGVKKIYVKDINLLSSDLPYGSHRLKGVTKDIIAGSNTFDVVNNIKDADFVIDPAADWYVASNNATPALQYKMSLLDKNGKKIDEWIEVIRQVKE